MSNLILIHKIWFTTLKIKRLVWRSSDCHAGGTLWRTSRHHFERASVIMLCTQWSSIYNLSVSQCLSPVMGEGTIDSLWSSCRNLLDPFVSFTGSLRFSTVFCQWSEEPLISALIFSFLLWQMNSQIHKLWQICNLIDIHIIIQGSKYHS